MVSIIIPTLNEALLLPALLDDLSKQQDIDLQIVVADGGSVDGTCEVAREHATVVQNPRAHRAEQLNLGAAQARHEWMLFLHADSRLRDPYLLRNALEFMTPLGPQTAGHFPLRFVGPDSEHRGFRYLSTKSALNRPFTINGDQGFLVHRNVFDAIGGFDSSMPFLEDQRFAQQVWRHGNWVTLPGELCTSTRRFSTEGFGRRYLTMAVVMGVNEAGVDDFFSLVNAYTPEPSELLDLGPIIAAIREITFRHGPDESFRIWSEVGQFIRLNAWQLGLVLDVYFLQDAAAPITGHFDRLAAPILDSSWADALASTLAASFFLVVLPSWWLTHKRAILRRQ